MTEERLSLAMERIAQIPEETGIREPFHDFFCSSAAFLTRLFSLREEVRSGAYRERSLPEMQELQDRLYREMLPGQYGESWLNPAYAAEKARSSAAGAGIHGGAGKKEAAGEMTGPALSALYAELYALPKFIFEGRDEDIAPVLEIYLQVFGLFAGGEVPSCASVRDALYWYNFDYLDVTVPERSRELLLPCDVQETLYHGMAPEDLRYLFLSGDYISAETLKTAAFLNSLPEEKARAAADAMVNGFLTGFKVLGKDLSSRTSVAVRFSRGFERLVKLSAERFAEAGLKTILPGSAVRMAERLPGSTERQISRSPNRQFDYDHRFDCALFWDKAFTDRKLSELRLSYGELREEAEGYAGPAVIETFGEPEFEPAECPAAFSLDPKQRKLRAAYMNANLTLRNEFMPDEKTSFTIIAWPLPETGDFFPALFDDILRINTLDTELYRDLQQKIIDVLDVCDHAEVKGQGGNETDLRIALRRLSDPARETRFENCVADVNIPAGEVFTSPVLEGTEGLLHVSEVYIDGLLFRDLRIRFERGRAVEARCGNFDAADETGKKDLQDPGRQYVIENIMGGHEVLPMGEFAVGTNTLACATARKYGIEAKMPILIAEKTGPHFALGDTCYSHEEDVLTYNPDGKAIVARDNEISARRKEAPEEAYFGHHKDITIPYEEIGSLSAVNADGTRTDIIRGGRFVLPGLEALNGPLDREF